MEIENLKAMARYFRKTGLINGTGEPRVDISEYIPEQDQDEFHYVLFSIEIEEDGYTKAAENLEKKVLATGKAILPKDYELAGNISLGKKGQKKPLEPDRAALAYEKARKLLYSGVASDYRDAKTCGYLMADIVNDITKMVEKPFVCTAENLGQIDISDITRENIEAIIHYLIASKEKKIDGNGNIYADISKIPNKKEFFYRLACILLERGDVGIAEKYADVLEKVNIKVPQRYWNEGARACLGEGRLDEAEKGFARGEDAEMLARVKKLKVEQAPSFLNNCEL